MADFRKQVEKILRDKGFLEYEYPEVFSAMEEILHAAAEKIEENEPYATNSIRQLREVSVNLSDMDDFIERYAYEKTED